MWMAAALMTSGAWAGGPQAAVTHQRPAASSPARREIVRPKLNDTQLEAAIRAKFAKSKINQDKFTVRVQGGVATVDGKTDVLQHKGVATRMCKTAGAAAVNNRVQISDAAKQKAAGNLEQGRRRVQVKRGDTRTERK
jgi:BON domain